MSPLDPKVRTDGIRARVFARRLLFMAVFTAIVFTLMSCAHTKIINSWKDPEYQGYPKKILVYAMAWDPDVKVISENLFVEEFEKLGIAAVASHKFLPDDLVVDKVALKKIVKDQKIDTVFIGGPRSQKDLQTLRPGSVSYETGIYADPDDGFYAAVSGFMYTPGTYAEEEVSWGIALYDVNTRKRIWSALSETYVENTRVEEIRPAVKRIMALLVKDKMVP